MIRSFTVAALAAVAVASSTADEFKTFDVAVQYDRAALETEKGAKETLNHIISQAKAECRVLSLTSLTLQSDDVCVSDIVRQAVTKIDSESLASAYAESDMFVPELSDRFAVAAK